MTVTFYVPSLTVDAVIDALGDFLELFVGTAEIIRAQVNRAPFPSGPCVVLTEILQVDLATPGITYIPDPADPDIEGDIAEDRFSARSPKRFDIQIDFYGPSSGDQCAAVKSVFRTEYAVSQFPAGIKPLYCSDGHQAPLISGEQQWESRWVLTASLQVNPEVLIPQQFADAATVDGFIEVDTEYL